MPRWGRSAVLSCDISSGPRDNGGKEFISSAISEFGLYPTSVFDPPSPHKSGSQKSALTSFPFLYVFSVLLFVFWKPPLFFTQTLFRLRSSLNSHGTTWSCTSCESQLKIVIARSPSNTSKYLANCWRTVWFVALIRSIGFVISPPAISNSMNSGETSSNKKSERFVWIDGFVPLKKLLDQILRDGTSSKTTNVDDIMHTALVDAAVATASLNGTLRIAR